MLKPRTLMVPILLVPSLGVFSFLIGLPSEAFADAGGWFHPPVEYTSTVEADNELGKHPIIWTKTWHVAVPVHL